MQVKLNLPLLGTLTSLFYISVVGTIVWVCGILSMLFEPPGIYYAVLVTLFACTTAYHVTVQVLWGNDK